MNWAHAKNIIIVMLIMVDLILLGIRINSDNSEYTLGNEELRNVIKYLNDEDISLYTLLPKEYKPLKKLEISNYETEIPNVVKKFFKKYVDVNKTSEGNKDVYFIDEDEYIEIYRNGQIRYVSKYEFDNEMSKEKANEKESEMLSRIYRGETPYKQVLYYKENDVYKFVYYASYKGNYIFNDYIMITVSSDRVEAEMMPVAIKGYVDSKEKIIPVDQALFNFSKNYEKTESDEVVYITDVQLGYYGNNDSLIMNGNLVIEPYYKISVKYGGEYYINAYTNIMYDRNLQDINVK